MPLTRADPVPRILPRRSLKFLAPSGHGARTAGGVCLPREGRDMACLRPSLVAMVIVVGVPASALAQASIAGTVRDSSGAVLPGVTVEASSPALIEKLRSGVTDGSGQYRIEQLTPGAYTVTFTLTGFSTVKREGL